MRTTGTGFWPPTSVIAAQIMISNSNLKLALWLSGLKLPLTTFCPNHRSIFDFEQWLLFEPDRVDIFYYPESFLPLSFRFTSSREAEVKDCNKRVLFCQWLTDNLMLVFNYGVKLSSALCVLTLFLLDPSSPSLNLTTTGKSKEGEQLQLQLQTIFDFCSGASVSFTCGTKELLRLNRTPQSGKLFEKVGNGGSGNPK